MSETYRWDRIGLITAVAVTGLGISLPILLDDTAPNALVAISGLLLLAGLAATVALLIFLWDWVANDLRPAVRCRRPVVPISLAAREAALVGRSNYRMHPIKFWSGLFFGNRLMIGLLVFDKPEHVRFDDATTPNESTPHHG